MDVVLGFDVGGTRTRCVAVDAQGRFRGLGEAPGANLREVGATGLASRIEIAASNALEGAGASQGEPAIGAFLGVAGCATEGDRREVRLAIGTPAWCDPERVVIDHDLRAAHAAAFALGPGIVLVAGTGSCAYGRDPNGRETRAGGWGGRLDDGGSGTWLGLSAIRASLRAEDGRAPETSLRSDVIKALGVSTMRDLVGVVESVDYRRRISGLAPLVCEAAESGDRVAEKIVNDGAEELVLMVAAVHRRMGGQTPVALHGGVLGEGLMRDLVRAAIGSHLPGVLLVDAAMTPDTGAALLALAKLGSVDQTQIDTLIRTSGRDRGSG